MHKKYHPLRSALTRRYSDLRVGAQKIEKRAHQTGSDVWLTFDDAGAPERVADLLSILRDHNVRAMFFVIGQWAHEQPGLIKAMHQDGHIVGRHTWSHPDLLSLNNEAVRREIDYDFDGELLRPPMGRYDDRIRRLVARAGLKLAYWTVDSDDWQGVDAAYITAKVVRETRAGGVVLFHIHGAATTTALPGVIAGLRAKGLQLAEREPAW